MFKKTRKISSLILIVSFLVSSSVCLEFFTMTALAASQSVAPKDLPGQTVTTDCSQSVQDMEMPVSRVNLRAGQNSESNDCCLNQDHHPSAASFDSNFSQPPISVFFSLAGLSLGLPATHFMGEAVFLPPPQTDSLRSIVKKE